MISNKSACGRLALPALAAALALGGCKSDRESFVLPQAGPGVIYTYPSDGQRDVATGAEIIVTFSVPVAVDADALSAGCDTSGDVPSGLFCVIGPAGAVTGRARIGGPEGNAIVFRSGELRPGTEYQVYVGPEAAGGAAQNLPAEGPLLRFYTRSEAILAGVLPTVLAVNGAEPGVFTPTPTAEARFPFLDFGTIRLLFSEPLDPFTVDYGSSISLVAVDPASGAETLVDSALLVQGIHVSVDPVADLEPGLLHILRLSDTITDMGGEPLAAAEYRFIPEEAETDGRILKLPVNMEPAFGDPGFPDETAATSVPGSRPNAIRMSYPLVGDNELFAKEGTMIVEQADPKRFPGGLIPVTIRRGQLLQTTGIEVSLGGVVPANLQTGDLTVKFLTDATGFLARNPFHPGDLVPDDVRSPVYVYMTFDIVVSASDPLGNAVLNQTVMNVAVTGVAVVANKSLAIEAAGTMELDLLGVAKAPANLVLRFQSDLAGVAPEDTQAPALLATYPGAGDPSVSPTDAVIVTFSEAIDPMSVLGGADGEDGQAIVLQATANDSVIEADVMVSGSSVILAPRSPLANAATYRVTLNPARITDLAGNALSLGDTAASFEFSTPAISPDQPLPPLLLALSPGVPCALEGATEESPGRCVGSAATDDLYAPFTMPAGRFVDAYFNQPIAPGSLTLGAACGEGSVRIERVDDTGACTAPVPGTLEKRDRGFRFYPTEPWVSGQRYQLVLVGGPNVACDGGEICGANGKPLNTDPLRGMRGDGARDASGGPDIVIPFVGAAPTTDAYLPSVASPVSDINGNGRTDPGEVEAEQGRSGLAIVGYGDSVVAACFPVEGEASCPVGDVRPEDVRYMYMSAVMPVSIEAAATNCVIGSDESGADISVADCVPARIFPQVILGTQIVIGATLEIDGFQILIPSLPTRQILLRMRDGGGAPAYGYIYEEPGVEEPQFVASLQVYMDAPDLVLPGGIEHDLHSKELSLTVRGPVMFAPDGRILINIANTEAVPVQVNIIDPGTPENNGFIDMQIPAGALKLQLISQPRQAALVRRSL